MIKKLLFLAVITLMVAACNNAGNNGEGDTMTVGQLLEQAENLVDQTVMVEGTVLHVCQHGGKRLFIKDAEGNEIKVESGDNIPQFDATLEGTDIIVEAIVRELRIDEAYLQEWEAELAAEAAAADTLMVEDAETMMEEAEEMVEEAVETTKEVVEEVVDTIKDMMEGEEVAHPEMVGKEDHHMDPVEKIAKYREEIAASEKAYVSQYWIEAISYKEKVAEGEEVVADEAAEETTEEATKE